MIALSIRGTCDREEKSTVAQVQQGISDALSHLLLKRKGGRDFTPSGRDIAGILDGDISGYAGS